MTSSMFLICFGTEARRATSVVDIVGGGEAMGETKRGRRGKVTAVVVVVLGDGQDTADTYARAAVQICTKYARKNC